MRKGPGARLGAALGLLAVLIGLAGCTTAGPDGTRKSSVTAYGTIDANVDVTR